MSSFGKAARFLVAFAVLTTATAGFAASSGADVPATAALTDNGNGTITLTYADTTDSDWFNVAAIAAGATCTIPCSGAIPFALTTSPDTPAPLGAGPSPLTIQVGSAGYVLSPSPGPTTLAAGTYTFCLEHKVYGSAAVVAQQLTATIGAPSPTTTVVEEPAAPAFTG